MPKVPLRTSVYKKEPIHKNSISFGFAPELIKLILNGKKTKTYKFGNKKNNIKKGEIVTILNSKSGKIISEAKIVNKKRVKFINLPIKEYGHESYRNKEHQRKVMSGYYAYLGRDIKDNDSFLVFEFKLVS